MPLSRLYLLMISRFIFPAVYLQTQMIFQLGKAVEINLRRAGNRFKGSLFLACSTDNQGSQPVDKI